MIPVGPVGSDWRAPGLFHITRLGASDGPFLQGTDNPTERHLARNSQGSLYALYIGRRQGIIRRVREVSLSRADAPASKRVTIAVWDSDADTFDVLNSEQQREAFAAWAGLLPGELQKQLETRGAILDGLLQAGTTSIPEVTSAVEAFYEQTPKSA